MIRNRNNIIKTLKDLSRKLNHSPSTREARPPLYEAARRYFGSFNKAKQAAALPVFPPKHHRINRSAKILNEDLAYIIGVIKGDGNCYKRKTPKRTNARIYLGVKDQDFACEFQKKLKKWSGIQPKFQESDGEFSVNLYSVDAVDIIQKFNFGQIIISNKAIKSNLLKGLYDSEGGVAGTNLDNRIRACRWIHFSNSDKEIIDIVSKFLKAFKIEHKIRSRIHSGFGSKKLQYELLIFGRENLEKFYKNIGFTIERKNKKLLEVINSYEEHKKTTTPYSSI